MLKEAVLKEMKELLDDTRKIIYEKSRINEKVSLETLVIIVKLSPLEFRVYQGYLHSSGNINVKCITIEEDMFNSMVNS